jgi:succinate dehydrogenase/fumarate reductase flavoprotein subunit
MGNIWWESNIRNLFPIGEVNGSHGVYRPGGSALNAGQVGSYRAAEYIAKAPPREYPSEDTFNRLAVGNGQAMLKVIKTVYSKNPKNSQSAKEYRDEFQQRMTNHGSHIRDYKYITKALENAYEQIERFNEQTISSLTELPLLFQNRHLVLAHAAYLDAIKTYLETGGGSRGSYIVMDPRGKIILDNLGKEWSYKPELSPLREKVLETKMTKNGKFQSNWKLRRKIPQNESWFENIWKKFRKGGIYLSPNET